jgi:quercetin dioxygenase-like cupin family protein
MDMQWTILPPEGDEFRAENVVGAGLAGPPLHVHPTAEETYQITEGSLDICVDGQWKTLKAGETGVAPAGVPHTLRNSTSEPVRLINVHRPALKYESFFGEMNSLIAEGKIKGLPPKEPRSAIYVAMLFTSYPAEIKVVKPPNALFKGLAAVGRLLGFKLGR